MTNLSSLSHLSPAELQRINDFANNALVSSESPPVSPTPNYNPHIMRELNKLADRIPTNFQSYRIIKANVTYSHIDLTNTEPHAIIIDEATTATTKRVRSDDNSDDHTNPNTLNVPPANKKRRQHSGQTDKTFGHSTNISASSPYQTELHSILNTPLNHSPVSQSSTPSLSSVTTSSSIDSISLADDSSAIPVTLPISQIRSVIHSVQLKRFQNNKEQLNIDLTNPTLIIHNLHKAFDQMEAELMEQQKKSDETHKNELAAQKKQLDETHKKELDEQKKSSDEKDKKLAEQSHQLTEREKDERIFKETIRKLYLENQQLKQNQANHSHAQSYVDTLSQTNSHPHPFDHLSLLNNSERHQSQSYAANVLSQRRNSIASSHTQASHSQNGGPSTHGGGIY